MSIIKSKQPITYFYLSSSSSFNLTPKGKSWDGTLQYSTDNSTWNDWDNFSITSNLIDGKHCIYLRGINNTYITNGSKQWSLSGNSEVSCHGNIENLLDYTKVEKNQHPLMAEKCFYRLFLSCSILTDISDLILPATVLSKYCYAYMFKGCHLKTIPKDLLPAKRLEPYCYAYMFGGNENDTDSGVANLPGDFTLPATKLASHCYDSMFVFCRKLLGIPENLLPAKELAPYCYKDMFTNCTNLKEIPVNLLPATKLDLCCYHSMFQNCSKLKSIPIGLLSSANDLSPMCYYNMFCYCEGLTSINDIGSLLPAQNLAQGCYYRMFQKCDNLERVSGQLFSKNTKMANQCCYGMFAECRSLNDITELKLSATTLMNKCYAFMFYSCINLSEIHGNLLPATNLAPYCYYCMFKDCWNLQQISSSLLPATSLEEYCYSYMFHNCDEKLTAIPNGLLFAKKLAPYCYSYMFSECAKLTTIPNELLPVENLAPYCYSNMFSNCVNLKAPEEESDLLAFRELLPAKNLAPYCYQSMFEGCSSLENMIKLPAENLPEGVYYQMFKNCTSLKELPALKTITPYDYCYYQMFQGCENFQFSTSYSSTLYEEPECIIDQTFNDFDYFYFTTIALPFIIWPGETYIVNWEGTTYTCEAKSGSFNDASFIYVGNAAVINGLLKAFDQELFPDTGEPFVLGLIVQEGQSQAMSGIMSLEKGTYSISVIGPDINFQGFKIPYLENINGTARKDTMTEMFDSIDLKMNEIYYTYNKVIE